jgi:hypothetical protein
MVLSAEQGIKLMVDWEEVPEEFLPVDQTSDTTLSDELKPEGVAAGATEADVLLASAMPQPGPADVLLSAASPSPTAESVLLQAAGSKGIHQIRALADEAIEKSYRRGMKDSLDTAAMQELVAAVKALEETAPQHDVKVVRDRHGQQFTRRTWVKP